MQACAIGCNGLTFVADDAQEYVHFVRLEDAR